MGLWMQGSSSCSLPCYFYREKPFLQDSGPLSPPPCVHGLCMCSLHIRGTSESPFIIHLFVSLALIFAGPLVLSVGSKGHPEQFLRSLPPLPSWAVSPPACRLCSQGCFGNCIFLMDQRDIGGKAGILPVSLGRFPSPGSILGGLGAPWAVRSPHWAVGFHPGCLGDISDPTWPPAPEGGFRTENTKPLDFSR